MPQRTDFLDIGRLGLTSGEGRRLDVHVHVDPLDYGGSSYAVEPELMPVRLDISRTTGEGWALRMRFDAELEGPCMRVRMRSPIGAAMPARVSTCARQRTVSCMSRRV